MSEHTTRTYQNPEAPNTPANGPPPALSADSLPPAAGGRYELLHELARGGMGIVYRATDTALGRAVAVKVLHERYGAESSAAGRFVREAWITGQLQHPGVPAVHDLGALPDGRPFLAMKLIEGRTLWDLLRERAGPSEGLGWLVGVFEQVCQAVGYAHAHGVIHRDLKPGNIMVGAFGEVQVMDWGLAKLLAGSPPDGPDPTETAAGGPGEETGAGSVLGTPAYMPPEQARGDVGQVDQRSDVFGLGAILCAILTGRPPYVGGDGASTRGLAARADLADAFARLDGCGADADLVALCKRCLAAERAARPADAGEVAQAVAWLRAAAAERARQADLHRARAEAEAREQRRRRRAQLALLLVVGLLLAGGGAFAWWQDRQASERRARRARNADALAALLDGCTEALRIDDADRAEALLKEAERRLPEGGDRLKGRLDARRADLAILRALDAADQFRWTMNETGFTGRYLAAGRIRAAFTDFGLVPGQTSADEAARRVIDSAVCDRLLAALDRWLLAERSAEVRALLRAADPDGFREAVRDAVQARDRARLTALAGRAEALAQPPRFAAVLGENPLISVGRRREVLAAALRQRPGDLMLLMGLGETYMLLVSASREPEVPLRWLQAAVAAHPRNAAAHNSLGLALWRKGDFDGAVACYQEAIRLDPRYAIAHNNLGAVLGDKGDFDGAVVCYRKALRLDPKHATIHYNLGRALRAKGDLDGAIACCQKALRFNPKFTSAHINLGEILTAKGDHDGAIACFQKAVRFGPEYAPGHYCLGCALQARGDIDAAIACYREALRLDPRHTNAYANLGMALEARADLPGAVACYKQALRLNPKLAAAHCNLGGALVSQGDFDGAIACCKEALRYDPKMAAAHNSLGVALRERGDLGGAVACFQEAARLAPNRPGIRGNIGQTEHWRALLIRLPDVAAGRAEPRGPAEAADFATLCAQRFQGRYATAVRLYESAFAAAPGLERNHGAAAACCASLAAARQGKDAESLPAAGQPVLRQKALAWLRADLARLRQQAASADPGTRRPAADELARWLRNWKLASLRPGADRTGWAPEEAAAWDRFWADVQAALDKALRPAPPRQAPTAIP